MVFKVAKDPSMAPAVIYIDECEKILAGGGKKKKGDNDGPGRFAKDLIKYADIALLPEDRVIIIGATSKPWDGALAQFKSLFNKHLFMPKPDYASRVMIWQRAIMEALTRGSSEWFGNHPCFQPIGWRDEPPPRPEYVPVELPEDFDISTLAHISEGYTAGSIRKAVKQTLTTRRVERLDKRPLTEKEFISAMSRCLMLDSDEEKKFRAFTGDVTGLTDAQEKAKKKLNGDDGDDGGKKKKKGGKKKKK